jgi:membrane associated rhomboid family serine protease
MSSDHDEYTALGFQALDEEDPERAWRHFKSALIAATRNGVCEFYSFHENLCVAGLAANKIKEADTSARKCIQSDSTNSMGHYLLGHVRLREKQYARAVNCFKRHVELCDERERNVAKTNLDTVRELRDEDFRVFVELITTAFSKCAKSVLDLARAFSRRFKTGEVIYQSLYAMAFATVLLCCFSGRRQCAYDNWRSSIYMCNERALALAPLLSHAQASDFCETLAGGHWVIALVIFSNIAAFPFALYNLSRWHVGKHNLTHERLLLYQFAHADLPHLMGNMGTLYAVGEEISMALGCDQFMLAALYLCSGWGGGLAAALLGRDNCSTVGASGSISGLIVALCVLRPNDAVRVIGDISASSPVQFMLATLVKDLLSPNVSWQGHLGGGLVGFIMCSCKQLIID